MLEMLTFSYFIHSYKIPFCLIISYPVLEDFNVALWLILNIQSSHIIFLLLVTKQY